MDSIAARLPFSSPPAHGRRAPDPDPADYIRLDLPHDSQPMTLEKSLLICGDAAKGLDLVPDGSVQTVLTSPPYWSLRDYGTAGQIGCSDALQDYVSALVDTFRQVRRTLASDGTLWLNMGDSYTSGNRRYRAPDRKNPAREMSVRPRTPGGLKPKDLIGVPWLVAHALQADGWWLRSEVIWYKPNAHPESVRDRPTKAHETIFLFSRQQRYHYSISALSGPNGRRLRTVWAINTEPQPNRQNGRVNHPAVMPSALADRCLLLTARRGGVVLDPYAGSGTTLRAARNAGCKWVGIEIKPEYADLIEARMRR